MILKITATQTVTKVTVLGKPYAVIDTSRANTFDEVRDLMENAGYDAPLTRMMIYETNVAKNLARG